MKFRYRRLLFIPFFIISIYVPISFIFSNKIQEEPSTTTLQRREESAASIKLRREEPSPTTIQRQEESAASIKQRREEPSPTTIQRQEESAASIKQRREEPSPTTIEDQEVSSAIEQKKVPPACMIPKLDPFSKIAMNYISHASGTCNEIVYGRIVDGFYYLTGRQYTNVRIQYIRRRTDFYISYSEEFILERNVNEYRYKLNEDHIKVTMNVNNNNHVEYLTHVTKTKERMEKIKRLSELSSGIPMNIVMLMYDSISRANMQRKALKTVEYLQNDEDSIIFEGHSIVGDGTTAQLLAILTGLAEEEQPETRRGFPNSHSCDIFNWIFKDLHNAGYVTAFGEDDSDKAAFHYRLKGFTNPLTTWYLRPFWLAYDQTYMNAPYCKAKRIVGLLKQFNEMFLESAKFSLLTVSTLCHGVNANKIELVDSEIVDTIKYFKNTKNTMFILFGDHGTREGGLRDSLQGKMEERLPFLSITLPSAFKSKYPQFYSAMQNNRNVLTSWFDVHATFKHILSYPDLPKGNLIGQSLFTVIDPQTRTCKSTGVDEHWCPCLDYTPTDVNDHDVQLVANAIVDFINNLVKKIGEDSKHCAVLKLDKIHKAGVRTPNQKVQKFQKTQRDHKCDSCGVVYDERIDTKKSSIKVYDITLVVSPSQAKFEANAKLEHDGTITVDPLISRINRYNNQPACIADKFPHARPYCYCQ